MFIEKIEQNIIKVNFYANEDELYIGDLLKVVSPGKKGVISQVIKIETPENNQNYNTATSKILFTVDTAGKLGQWHGNVPGNDFVVSKVPPKEVQSITKTGDVPNSALSGKQSCCPETIVNIEASFLENPTVIVADKETQKNNLLELLAVNLSEKNAKVVLIDYNGEFFEDGDALVLKAGKDVKLPFDLNGIENLYNKALSGVSGEIRASIENIFSEIEDYLTSKKVSFLPFKFFVDAVNAESEANSMPELDLLSNSLGRLHKKGIFADGQKEIINLFNSLNDNNLVILDLSGIDNEWKPFFIDFIIRLNKENLKRKFFLLMDLDRYKAPDVLEKIFNRAVKSGIRPIVSIGHESELALKVLSEIENSFVFAPQNGSKLLNLTPYLTRLGLYDILACGKITNHVPLYMNLPVFEEPAEGFFSAREISDPVEIELDKPFIPPKTAKAPEEVFEVQQVVSEHEEFETRSVTYDYREEPAREVQQEEEFAPLEETQECDYEEPGAQEFSREEIYEEECHESDEQDSTEEEESYAAEYSPLKDMEPEETYFQEDKEEDSGPDFDLDVDDQDSEYAKEDQQGEAYDEEDDEDAYYASTEEFQDESALDYVSGEETEEDEEAYDEGELDYVGDEEDYSEQEYAEEEVNISQPADSEAEQEFSDDDLRSFMDYDENETDRAEEDEDAYYESNENFQDDSVLDYAEAESGVEPEQEYEQEYTAPAQSSNAEQEFSDDDLRNFMDYDEGEEAAEQQEPEEVQPQKPAKKMPKKPQPRKMKPAAGRQKAPPTSSLPVYDVPASPTGSENDDDLQEGDTIRHKKYGIGVIKKVIGYSEKKLCSIQFEDVGRRLLDPKIAELEKI